MAQACSKVLVALKRGLKGQCTSLASLNLSWRVGSRQVRPERAILLVLLMDEERKCPHFSRTCVPSYRGTELATLEDGDLVRR